MFQHIHQHDGVKLLAGRNHVVKGFHGDPMGGGVFQWRDFFAELVETKFVWLQAGDEARHAGQSRGEVANAAPHFQHLAVEKGYDHFKLPALVVLGSRHLPQVFDIKRIHCDSK